MLVASIMSALVSASGNAEPGQASRDVGDGLAGAALCVAAADYVANAGDDQTGAAALASRWRTIMSAVAAEPAIRDSAVERARRSIEAAEARRAGMGVMAADATLDAACRSEETQSRYLQRFGKPELMSQGAEQHG